MPSENPENQNVKSQLHEAGLRATKPRSLVFSAFLENKGHWSVDQIADMLVERGSPVPRMSVYNVVADLQQVGLLMCADTGPGRALYEASHEWHHHFVCRSCSAVFDVPCIKGQKPCLDPPVPIPGEVDEAQVIFRGICDQCRRKQTPR